MPSEKEGTDYMVSSKTRAAAHSFLSGTLLATASLTLLASPAAAEPPGDAKGDHAVARGGNQPAGRPPARALDGSPTASRIPGELLVRFEPGVSASARAAARDRVGAKVARKLPVRGLELLKVHGVDAARTALEKRPGVRYAEPNFVYQLSSTPDDPRFVRLWGLHNNGQTAAWQTGTPDADIDAPEAWDSVTGDPDVTVAVVDSGVAYRHPDLDGNIWSNPGETLNGVDDDGNGYVDDVRGWDWADGDNDPDDVNGHGTHVAGTIAAEGDNGKGVAGVTWDASVMPLRVLDAAGSGTAADMVEAIAYAQDKGADVLNASLGGPEYSQALADAISGAPDLLVVVAAGNEGADNEDASTPTYPCNFPSANLVCVAASDNQDNLAEFSNFGTTGVDLAAPGVEIYSTVPARTVPFSEGFGPDNLGKFTSGGTSRWGTEGATWSDAYASDSVWSDYAANADTWLRTSTPVDLSDQHGCVLDFELKLDLEDGYDFLSAEVRTAGGAWTSLGEATGQWGPDWYGVTAPLDGYDGDSAVDFRFRLVSDGSIQYSGARIDNVHVKCVGESYAGNEFGYESGTSMATPHVSGAAALLFAAAPAASAADVRQALLDGVDAKASLAGKTATGGRLNVKNALDRVVPIVQPSRCVRPPSPRTAERSP